MLELVQRWGRTAQLAALAGFLRIGQENLSKKGTRCTDIWRGIWLPQHRHLMPIRRWRELACLPAAIPAAQVLCHICKRHKDTSDGLTVNSSPVRIKFSICLSFIQNCPSKRSPRWAVHKLESRWKAVPASRSAAEVETDSSPDISPTWLPHITLPTSLKSSEAGYSQHTISFCLFPPKQNSEVTRGLKYSLGGDTNPKIST